MYVQSSWHSEFVWNNEKNCDFDKLGVSLPKADYEFFYWRIFSPEIYSILSPGYTKMHAILFRFFQKHAVDCEFPWVPN